VAAYLLKKEVEKIRLQVLFRALTMQDSITESKTINYTLFMVFC